LENKWLWYFCLERSWMPFSDACFIVLYVPKRTMTRAFFLAPPWIQFKYVSVKVIWQVTDGKRGHENQCSGLVHALSHEYSIDCHRIASIPAPGALFSWVFGRKHKAWANLPQPDLVIGAGSSTHLTLLAAARSNKVPGIVLMSPPIYLRPFFDLCIVPEHDGIRGANVVTTKGAIHAIRSEGKNDKQQGLFLIGGPSKHHNWDLPGLLAAIGKIASQNASVQWTLTDSRRTQEETRKQLQSLDLPNITVVGNEDTGNGWVQERLCLSGMVWVTEDSVSMVYEALSSGARVGILPVPRKSGASRVIEGLDALKKEKRACFYQSDSIHLGWYDLPDAPPLAEADRIARMIAEKYLRKKAHQ